MGGLQEMFLFRKKRLRMKVDDVSIMLILL